MHWTIILFLISLIINGIIVYLLRNSHDYHGDEPIKFPLIIWIFIGISTCIPIINSIGSIILIVFAITNYSEEDIVFNDDFWLTKEY